MSEYWLTNWEGEERIMGFSPEIINQVPQLMENDMTQIELMKNYLRRLKEMRSPDAPVLTDLDEKKTHLFEILLLLREGIGEFGETANAYYSLNSLTTEVKFADGKTYLIEIREKGAK